MEKIVSSILAIIAWFAVIAQFVLMLQNRQASTSETIIRFFSFFTILTNILVGVYFTFFALKKKESGEDSSKSGLLTPVTIYITIVGLIYQLVLRSIWQPTGLQQLVNELLHSVIPVLVILFWIKYEHGVGLKYGQIFMWCSYPLLYLLFVLVRGHFADYYPYPFLDVLSLGYKTVLINALFILLIFLATSCLFVFVGRRVLRKS